jgi:hypothetical protein
MWSAPVQRAPALSDNLRIHAPGHLADFEASSRCRQHRPLTAVLLPQPQAVEAAEVTHPRIGEKHRPGAIVLLLFLVSASDATQGWQAAQAQRGTPLSCSNNSLALFVKPSAVGFFFGCSGAAGSVGATSATFCASARGGQLARFGL